MDELTGIAGFPGDFSVLAEMINPLNRVSIPSKQVPFRVLPSGNTITDHNGAV